MNPCACVSSTISHAYSSLPFGLLVFLEVLVFFLIDQALLYLGKHFKSILDLLLVLFLHGNDTMDVDGLVL